MRYSLAIHEGNVRDSLDEVTAMTHEPVARNTNQDDWILDRELHRDEANFDIRARCKHDDNS
jgi:hypothetical protein